MPSPLSLLLVSFNPPLNRVPVRVLDGFPLDRGNNILDGYCFHDGADTG